MTERPRRGIPGLDRLFIVLALAALTLAALSPVLRNAFVNYDDGPYVTENAQVRRGITGAGVVWALTSTAASNWHPVTWLSHMLDVQVWGLDPRGHHATSLLLHTLSAVLLYLLLEGMTGARWPSALAAALFAVHPLHVESVAWVAERKDVLSGLFLMSSLAAYHRYAQRPGPARYALVALCFALGLMSKPMLVTTPFVLLLLDYWPLGRPGPGTPRPAPGTPSAVRWSWTRLVLEKIPLFALAAASCVITLVAQSRGGSVTLLERLPFPQRALNAAISCAGYLIKMLYPVRLAVFYPHPQNRVAWAWGAAAGLGIAVVTVLVVRARRRPFLAVGWLWYLGALVPVIGLVQVGVQSMADRYTYLPLIGVFVMAAWGLAATGARLRPWAIAVAVAALCALSARTYVQAGTWRSSFTLFSQALAVTERNAEAHNGLGNVFYREGRLAEAESQYREAIRFDPENPELSFNLGLALSQRGRLREAETCFRRALQQGPDRPMFHNSLGRVLQRLGNLAEASERYRRAIELDAGYVLPRIGEGSLQFQLGNYAAAAAHLRVAARLQPESPEIAAALAAAESRLQGPGLSQP